MSEQRAQGMVNTVNVFSIDEERLRYRVVVSIKGLNNYEGRGQYKVDFPIPTSFNNSHEYSQCLMKCDSFTAFAPTNIADASWGAPPPAAVGTKLASLELRMSVPTSQSVKSSILGTQLGAAGEIVPTETEMGSFVQILPGQVINTGNGTTFAVGATSGDKAWMSISGRAENPIMCGNPFGQQVSIVFRDPITTNDVYIQNTAAGGGNMGPEQGHYVMQFDITMIPN
tara:strand:- start:754 stop:1434 length:681 start_codon:yes stop_codon:yes gene_type:complete